MMLVAVGFAVLTTCGGTTTGPGGGSSGTGDQQCGACELNQPCNCNPDPCQVCMCTLGGACTTWVTLLAEDVEPMPPALHARPRMPRGARAPPVPPKSSSCPTRCSLPGEAGGGGGS